VNGRGLTIRLGLAVTIWGGVFGLILDDGALLIFAFLALLLTLWTANVGWPHEGDRR
jgi:hypothetical protein